MQMPYHFLLKRVKANPELEIPYMQTVMTRFRHGLKYRHAPSVDTLLISSTSHAGNQHLSCSYKQIIYPDLLPIIIQ
jgi:hypothetical protein